MPLKPCRECGHQVSTNADVCPHCGTSSPAGWRPARHHVLAGLLLLAILAAIFSSDDADRSEPVGDAELKGNVSFTGTQFVLMNNDVIPWTNCKLEVNGDYELGGVNVAAGSSATMGAATFADGNGMRFNPFTMKPQSLSARCEIGGGRKGFFYGGWR